jgi:hypothetical protein
LANFRELIAGNELIVAPVALNPIMARLAEAAGFKAVYLSGGSLGWYKGVTEANITITELAQVAVDMRAASKLPVVLDAGGGFGDPVHMHRTIALTEAAGFAAIEIEDQLLPRRFEHHAGIDHLVPMEFMLKRLGEALAARSDPNLVIIARTNAQRVGGLDDALRRGEAFHKAGADMLFVYSRTPEEMRIIGERLPPPLMTFAPPDGFAEFPMSPARPGQARLPSRRFVRHRVCRHAQGGEAIVRMPGARQARSLPRPRRRRERDEGRAGDLRFPALSRHRTAHHRIFAPPPTKRRCARWSRPRPGRAAGKALRFAPRAGDGLGRREALPGSSRSRPAVSSFTARTTAPHPGQPDRHRDRGGARLRHRPSRHHARLSAGARPDLQIAERGGKVRAHPRSRHRQRRPRHRRGAGLAATRAGDRHRRRARCAPHAPTPGSTAPAAWSRSCTADGVTGARRARAPFDLIFANILLGPLQRFAAPLTAAHRARRPRRPVRPAAVAGECRDRRLSAAGARTAHRLDGWTTLVCRAACGRCPRHFSAS